MYIENTVGIHVLVNVILIGIWHRRKEARSVRGTKSDRGNLSLTLPCPVHANVHVHSVSSVSCISTTRCVPDKVVEVRIGIFLLIDDVTVGMDILDFMVEYSIVFCRGQRLAVVASGMPINGVNAQVIEESWIC